jgi:hypothetical protein
MKLPDIAKDKLKHFFYATHISFIIINLAYLLNLVWSGYVLCLLGFILWEFYQKYVKVGTFSLMDWLFGSMAATLILLTKLL